MDKKQIIGTENINRPDKLDFNEVKKEVLNQINSKDHYVPYYFIKGIILSNFTSTRWSNETTYGLKHEIERLYTEVMNNGKSYYCSNDWCKCAIYDINMYDKNDGRAHNKFDIVTDYWNMGNDKYGKQVRSPWLSKSVIFNNNAATFNYKDYSFPLVYVTTPNTIIQEGCNWWFKVRCNKDTYVQRYIG